jgi:glycyl-tRNA synthetase (class II)
MAQKAQITSKKLSLCMEKKQMRNKMASSLVCNWVHDTMWTIWQHNDMEVAVYKLVLKVSQLSLYKTSTASMAHLSQLMFHADARIPSAFPFPHL